MVILMQEDVENRTINFAISTTKLTGRAILAAARKFLQWRDGQGHRKPTGKHKGRPLSREGPRRAEHRSETTRAPG